MLPFLVDWQIGDTVLRLPSYGVFLAIAFSSGYFVAIRHGSRLGLLAKDVENLFLLVVLASVVGARGFHVLFEDPSYYWAHPLKVFAVWEGGYVFYGAVLLGIGTLVAYCRWKKIHLFDFLDIATTSTLLGLCIGRLGCFMAGCCWGKPTGYPWGVKFTHPDTFARTFGHPVHPTQLYEAAAALVGFAYVQWLFKQRRYQGQIFFHGVIYYSIFRFCVEFYRGDEERGVGILGALSTSQLISLFLLPAAVGGILWFRRASSSADHS